VTLKTDNKLATATGWRAHLPVHPAADLFPLMTPDELTVLGEDIKRNGLQQPVFLWAPGAENAAPDMTKFHLLDGRNRLDAAELVGLQVIIDEHGVRIWNTPTGPAAQARFEFRIANKTTSSLTSWVDPYAYVVSANVHRRHLTAEQKREIISKLIKVTPEKSDRQIAEATKSSPTTVGKVRAAMQAVGDVSKLDTRIDSNGRQQRATKPVKSGREEFHGLTSHRHLKLAEHKRRRLNQGMGTPPATALNPTSRDDIGPNSIGETERLRARNQELEDEKRRLEIENAGLRREIKDLKAKLAAHDDGIPAFLRRAAADGDVT
jgi:hypothetical protein